MSLSTAAKPWSEPSAYPPPRRLWQVPVFLLGLAVLTGVALLRPLWRNPLAGVERGLNEAREVLARSDGDPAEAIRLARAYLDKAGDTGGRSGEAYYLLGKAHAVYARRSGGQAATSLWRQAHTFLQQAERFGVSESDRLPLLFQLGQAGHHAGADPVRVAELLAESVESADDKVEGYRLLTLACLSQTPPDLEGALKANEGLRQLPLLGEDVLGPARVRGGEVLLRLDRPAEARKALEKVGDLAPAAVKLQARSLRARSLQDEENWAAAAGLWQEVLDDPKHPPADPGPVLYQLGVCYGRLDQWDDAAHAWEECLHRGTGSAAAAAALGLADIRLAEADPAPAAEAFERAVRDVRQPADWANPYVDLAKARELFERGCKLFLERGDFERAAKVGGLYTPLAPDGRGHFLRGQAADGWARGLREQARQAANTSEGKLLEEKAIALFRQAGTDYEQSATLAAEPPDQKERLWFAANAHFQGGDPKRTVAVLEQFLRRGGHASERAGEAWFLLAEAQRSLKNDTAADAAYHKAIEHPNRFTYLARYEISQAELKRGNVDLAADALSLNINLLRTSPDAREQPLQEALEKTLYALGHILYQGHKYQAARPYLEEALSKFPESLSGVRGRFELAETYRHLAAEDGLKAVTDATLSDATRNHYRKQSDQWLKKAVEQYRRLGQQLAARPDTPGPLTARERMDVFRNEAECLFYLGQHDTAMKRYEALAVYYKGRAERLLPLGDMARLYLWLWEVAAHAGRAREARQHLASYQRRMGQIRSALGQMTPEAGKGWQGWLADLEKLRAAKEREFANPRRALRQPE